MLKDRLVLEDTHYKEYLSLINPDFTDQIDYIRKSVRHFLVFSEEEYEKGVIDEEALNNLKKIFIRKSKSGTLPLDKSTIIDFMEKFYGLQKQPLIIKV